MPNTKKQYAGGKRPGKTKRFFKALATGSTKTKVSVQDTEHKTKKLHASEQKLKEIESQVRRTQKAANTHAATKLELAEDINVNIRDIKNKFQRYRQIKKKPALSELHEYQDLKVKRTKLRQELKKTKAAYYEHLKLIQMKGRAEIKVNKRKKTLKAYEQAAEKLALQKFNKKRWVTGWDKKYKKASVADIHKFINVDSKLDTFKTVTNSEGKPVKKLLKQFEFDDFVKHKAQVDEVINSFPGVKEYSAKIGIDIDRLNENQKAMLAHKMIEITKNPDLPDKEMATEMVKSVVVTKFASPEIKVDAMGYVEAPAGLGYPAPGYNPEERRKYSNFDWRDYGNIKGKTVSSSSSSNLSEPYLKPRTFFNEPYGNVAYTTVRRQKEAAYLEPRTVSNEENPYGNVEYTTVRRQNEAEYLKPRTVSNAGPVYNTASAGPASQEPIYNNPANLQALANQSAHANPERTGTIKLKAGPNTATPNTEGIYANMNTAEPTYNNPK